MATNTEPERPMRRTEKAALVAFFVALVLYYLVSQAAGTRAFGAWLVLLALALHTRGYIEFWISGRPGGWKLSGPLATLLNVFVAVTGLAVFIWPDVAIGILGGGTK